MQAAEHKSQAFALFFLANRYGDSRMKSRLGALLKPNPQTRYAVGSAASAPKTRISTLAIVEQGDPFISAAQSPCGLTDTLRSFSVAQ
jgi:hypothetical protein